MSRIYLKSTVLLTVFFLLCLATLVLAQEPCGSWSFAGWIQSGTVQWTADANGDPVPSVEGNAVEQETWYDPCEGTENDPQTASHGYSLVSDEVVYNPDDGQFNRVVTYSASSSYGGRIMSLPAVMRLFGIGHRLPATLAAVRRKHRQTALSPCCRGKS